MADILELPAVKEWIAQGVVQKQKDDDRRLLAAAIDTARRVLNPIVYNVYDGGTLFGHMVANANAYNAFRENK